MKKKRNIFNDLRGLNLLAKSFTKVSDLPVYKGQDTTELHNSDERSIKQRLSKKGVKEAEENGWSEIELLLQCAWRLGHDAHEANSKEDIEFLRLALRSKLNV